MMVYTNHDLRGIKQHSVQLSHGDFGMLETQLLTLSFFFAYLFLHSAEPAAHLVPAIPMISWATRTAFVVRTHA